MFLPFLRASSDCIQPGIQDRNIAERKMLVYDLPIPVLHLPVIALARDEGAEVRGSCCRRRRKRRSQARKLRAGKFGERDPIFLPSMFLPFLRSSSDCFQPAIQDRNIADRKMLVYDLPIPVLHLPVIALARDEGAEVRGSCCRRRRKRRSQARKLRQENSGKGIPFSCPQCSCLSYAHPAIAFSQRFRTGILLTGKFPELTRTASWHSIRS